MVNALFCVGRGTRRCVDCQLSFTTVLIDNDNQPDCEPGNLVFIVQQEEHPKFTRRSMHLLIDHTITLSEALLGFKVACSKYVKRGKMTFILLSMFNQSVHLCHGTPECSLRLSIWMAASCMSSSRAAS